MFKPLMLSLFKKSPLKSLQAHMHIVLNAAGCLQHFFAALLQENWLEVEQIRKQIEAYEQDADHCKRKLRITLHRDILSSLPRSDMLALISIQDSIANQSKHISGIVVGRKMLIPKQLQGLLTQYVETVIATCHQASAVLDELNQLVASGFSERIIEVADRHIKKLSKMEKDTDQLQVKMRLKLFALEKKLDPVSVMFLYQVIEAIGSLADCAENVGDRALLLIAK
jgi:uncharacterized protein